MDKKLIDKVDDGFNYFNSGILEELTTDKKYYVKAFMDYIEELENKSFDESLFTKGINKMENKRIHLLLDEVYAVIMKESIEVKKTFLKERGNNADTLITMSYDELKTITQYNTEVMIALNQIDDVQQMVHNLKIKQ